MCEYSASEIERQIQDSAFVWELILSDDNVELDVEDTESPKAKSTKKKRRPSVEEQEPDSPPVATPSVPQQQQQQQQTLTVDDSAVTALYANFCRISSTPEELILDLGLNVNPMSPGEAKVQISERIILNHYTAKRLLAALATTLQQHENIFGALETDVRRRAYRM